MTLDWRAVFGAICRAIARHPFLTIFAILVLLMVGLSMHDAAVEEAYQNSPEGRAEAARRDAEAQEASDAMLAKAMVQAWLRDPDSAQFIGVHTVHRDGVKAVCGFVNARNAFGGMTGNEAFVVIGTNAILAGSASAKEEAELNKLCFDR